MKTIIVCVSILTLLTGCASGPFSQEVMADGKTWKVKAYKIECHEVAACKANIKVKMSSQGKLICGREPFRVISCNRTGQLYGNIEADCLIKCGEMPAATQSHLSL